MERLRAQFANIMLLLLGAGLVILYWSDKLGLYVRPDYHVFSYLMGIVLLAVGYAGFWVRPGHHHGGSRKNFVVPSLLAAAFIALWAYGVLGPRVSLSPRAAMNRGMNQNAASGATGEKSDDVIVSPLLSLSQTDSYTLADWTRLLRRDPEPQSHEGKKVRLEGFVQLLPDGRYAIARFIISCCTVDASPIGLRVDAPSGDLIDGQWILLEGQFAVETREQKRELVIVPERVEKIEEPALPYLY